MASLESDIPQCINSNEPEKISQSKEPLESGHCSHMQMSSHCVPIQYPSDIKTDSARKTYKQKLLKENPETLFSDQFKTGEVCNLIFFTDHPSVCHKAIIIHYPSVKKEGICNGWKLKIKDPNDSDSTEITVNIYKNGTVMVQGNLKLFQDDYSTICEIMRQEKSTLPQSLPFEETTQNSTTNVQHITTESAESESPSQDLLKTIPLLQEHFSRLEIEMVQLKETVLKHQQPIHSNTENITQRLTTLTQQMKKLQTENDSYKSELSTLRLQLQDREQSTREMKQQIRELQEERQQHNSEIQALKEQVIELLKAREELQQIQRPSETTDTGCHQIPPHTSPNTPDTDGLESSQHVLSDGPTQQNSSDSSTEKPQIALLIDSNGKFIDMNKLFPRHTAVKLWCPNTDRALELLTESQLGRPSHIIIHTGTNDLRNKQDRVSDSLRAVVDKARHTFPDSKIILSTLLQRRDFHPDTINKINASISRHCALLPNVHLAHHPDLDTDCLYDHVHLYKNLTHVLAKRLKDVALSRTSQTSPRWSKSSSNPAIPTRQTLRNNIPPSTSSRAPARALTPRQESHRQRLFYKQPTAPAEYHRTPEPPPQQTRPPVLPGKMSYAQAASGGINPTNADLHDIQNMLSIICSHILTHNGQM